MLKWIALLGPRDFPTDGIEDYRTLQALRWFATLLPQMLSERRTPYRSAGVSPQAHLARFISITQQEYKNE